MSTIITATQLTALHRTLEGDALLALKTVLCEPHALTKECITGMLEERRSWVLNNHNDPFTVDRWASAYATAVSAVRAI